MNLNCDWALDLTAYGRRLSSQFQYKGDQPFEDIYPSHAFYLGALLGEDVDAAVEYFRERAESLDPREHGGLPVEAYVQLLDRLGRYAPAIGAAPRFCPSATRRCDASRTITA